MKSSFLMFFLIAVCIYVVSNTYLFIRGWQSLEIIGRHRVWFATVFWIVALSFLVSQILASKGVIGAWSNIGFTVGSSWLAVLLYGFLLLLTIDLLRMIGWVAHIRPDFIYRNYLLSKTVSFGAVCLILAVVLGLGFRNARHPQVTHREISVDKGSKLEKLRVVMVSDIHLGHINGRKSLARIVDVINEQHPDIILLAGDTFDGAPTLVIRKNMGVEFDRLQSTYGAYAVSGNHEYIGVRERNDAVDTALGYLDAHGVQPLQDAVTIIDSCFYVAGRKDRSAGTRKSISELLQGIDQQLPVIMLDHQPYHLDRVAKAGVDLHLSGHTHHGQMWPMSLITRKIYEQDWGFLQKDKSNFYISCGVGTWGPPIRTAGYSEIVVIDLKLNR